MQNLNQCISCQNNEYINLPIPRQNQSMLSDGKMIKKSLAKKVCTHCGLVKHQQSISHEEIRSFYENDYGLTKQDDQYEKKRATSYTNAIHTFLAKTDLGSILEIGCGSGFLLKELHSRHSGNHYEGFDPALIEKSAAKDDILVYKASDLTNTKRENYQTIISINTLEHIADPYSYLKQISQKMTIASDLILVLPSHLPANVELLFFDHLWTYTPIALSNLLKPLKMSLIQYEFLKNDLLGFTIYRISKNMVFKEIEYQPTDIFHIQSYLKAWQQLDLKLCAFFNELLKSSIEIYIFGAGQMTALLKSYAPNAFKLCHAVVADVSSTIWQFNHFETYEHILINNQSPKRFLISVHPTIEDDISKKISNDGFTSMKLSSFLNQR